MTRPTFDPGDVLVARTTAGPVVAGHLYEVQEHRRGVWTGGKYDAYAVRDLATGTSSWVFANAHNWLQLVECQDCDLPVDREDVEAHQREVNDRRSMPARCRACEERWDHGHRAVRA